MGNHETIVKQLVDDISNVVNNESEWKVTIVDNNKLQDMVYELLNEICHVYTENIGK